MRVLVYAGLAAILCVAAFGQSTEAPLADVHASGRTTNPFMKAAMQRGGRYEVHTATMLDLIRTAYGMDADKVLGGPAWLESDRFDIIAKVPADSTPEALKVMLQTLLTDRFKLVVRREDRPLPAYALIAGKKPQLKQSDGTEVSECRIQSRPASPGSETGGIRIFMNNSSISLGPDMMIPYQCRNMTMEKFAGGLRNMLGASLGTSPVVDQTELKGAWNFDFRLSLTIMGPMATNATEHITIFDAVEKQLGLKLDPRKIPTPVIVVESVNEKPSENPAEVAEALPVIPAPTEFEVANIKPGDPAEKGGRFQLQPGGRLTAENMPMRFLLNRAFNTTTNDQLAGIPKWVDAARFDITAKAPSGVSQPDMDSIGPMLRSLLVERFGLKAHTEERSVSSYTLVAAKPKMKKADPANRTSCRNSQPPPGTPKALSAFVTCQNITMAQFADQLQNFAGGYLNWPVSDTTGLEGAWDFTLSFSPAGMLQMGGSGGGRSGDGGPQADAPAAGDPSGALSLFEALEKEVGLKLEPQKRTAQVTVIDHLDEKPTDN